MRLRLQPLRNIYTFGSGSSLRQKEARRNGVETEKNNDKTSNCNLSVTCDNVRCFQSSYFLELN